jgi:hypothetical protein
MRSRSWTRLGIGVALATCTAAVLFGYIAGSAPAGNRAPNAAVRVFPGPTAEVTYGKAVAYTATVTNAQTSKFTHLKFHDPIPFTFTVNGDGTTKKNYASFKYSSCPGNTNSTEFVSSDLGSVSPGSTTTCVIVWQTPNVGSSDDPLTSDDECVLQTFDENGNRGTTPPCIANQPYWSIKEGTGNPGSAGPDTFFTNNIGVHLLATTDPTEARGYEIDGCSDVSGSGALGTGPIGSGNPFRASICVGAASLPGTEDPVENSRSPGLVQTIAEGPHTSSDNGFTPVAQVCVPSPPDQSCSDPWTIDPPGKIKLEFDTQNLTIPPGEKIDVIYHDNVDVTDSCTFSGKKIAVAVCDLPANGRWTGG